MAWKSIKGAVYKQLDEGAFYVEVAEWVASGPCELGKAQCLSQGGLSGTPAQSLACRHQCCCPFVHLASHAHSAPGAILIPKMEGGPMSSLVETQFLSKCQLGQLALNRPSLLPKGLAKPKLACSILKLACI